MLPVVGIVFAMIALLFGTVAATKGIEMQEKVAVAYTKMPHAAAVPTYKTAGSSGADLTAAEDVTIFAGKFALVSTGIRIAFTHGASKNTHWEAQVRSRSGLAAKHGVFVLNSPGTIDMDYRGEIKVILMNTGREPFHVKRGDRIAQLVFNEVMQGHFLYHEEAAFDEEFATERGSGGFGSTGTK
jgi:dUTP pyrophosphatase